MSLSGWYARQPVRQPHEVTDQSLAAGLEKFHAAGEQENAHHELCCTTVLPQQFEDTGTNYMEACQAGLLGLHTALQR
jgi:hypothetical protein